MIRKAIAWAAALAFVALACVDMPSGPNSHEPATVQLLVELPPSTPAIW